MVWDVLNGQGLPVTLLPLLVLLLLICGSASSFKVGAELNIVPVVLGQT